jgi:hypothetical protein
MYMVLFLQLPFNDIDVAIYVATIQIRCAIRATMEYILMELLGYIKWM